MLSLDGGDGCGNCRRYRACYRLLDRGVHDLRVDRDLLETGNCFRELVCLCELRGVVKTRGSGSRCSRFSFGDVEERGILWLDSSNAINEVLEGRVDARSFPITCVALELMDVAGKALDFS